VAAVGRMSFELLEFVVDVLDAGGCHFGWAQGWRVASAPDTKRNE